MNGFFEKKIFLGLIFGLFFVSHLYRITDGPNGFHKWRETDTAAVAYNFFSEDWNFFQPRIDERENTSGVVGMELPVYSYLTAICYQVFGFSHAWPRLLSVLGALVFLGSLSAILRVMGASSVYANLAAYAGLASPLIFFYGRKIQPDMWALSLSTTGVYFFLKWHQQSKAMYSILSVLFLAVAGMIKPTMLCVGLPMLCFVRAAWLKPRYFVIVFFVILPVFLWMSYAKITNQELGRHYFDLTLNLGKAWHYAYSPKFVLNLLVTWPWELVIGYTAVWFFLWGIVSFLRDRSSLSYFLFSWLLGGLVVCSVTADHVATLHDYYLLPLAPPLILITAKGAECALRSYKAWVRILAVLTLFVMPPAAFVRMFHRYGEPYDFHKTRALADESIPKGAKIITYDNIPGWLFYRVGRKGWRIQGASDLEKFSKARELGANYFVIEPSQNPDITLFRPFMSGLVFEDQTIQVYKLSN